MGLAALVVLLCAAAGVYYATLPSVSDAERRIASQLERRDGSETARVPARVASAVIAIEDRRFYDHGALDLQSIVRAAWTSITRQGIDPGGSTITQQLAKLLYPGGSGFGGRVHDIGTAFKLEQRYSKPQILEMYLTVIYLGSGYYGIRRAAHGYYRRAPELLSWAQAATLAGLLQAPSAFDPRTDFPAARHRQRQVLDALVRAGRLTSMQADRIYADVSAARPVGAPGRPVAAIHPQGTKRRLHTDITDPTTL